MLGHGDEHALLAVVAIAEEQIDVGCVAGGVGLGGVDVDFADALALRVLLGHELLHVADELGAIGGTDAVGLPHAVDKGGVVALHKLLVVLLGHPTGHLGGGWLRTTTKGTDDTKRNNDAERTDAKTPSYHS